MIDIVDCTLRDGGYYTDWDFDNDLVVSYFAALKESTIGTIELGYRSPKKVPYHGKYFYLSRETLAYAKKNIRADQKIAIMLNAKDCTVDNITDLILPVCEEIDVVRFAVSPDMLLNCIECAKNISGLGVEIAFNIMYLHKYIFNFDKIGFLADVKIDLSYISFVDSYGSVLPADVATLFKKAKSRLPQKLGFHGHANIGLAFANSLAAIENGCSGIDSTFLGMGRGAGNLQTELLLAYIAKNEKQEIKNFALSHFIEKLNIVKKKYEWGTSLPYMVSGLNSLPQGEVMDLLSKNRYSLSTCLKLIQNKTFKQNSNLNNISSLDFRKNEMIMIIGGGDTIKETYADIEKFLKREKPILILSSTKYLIKFHKIILENHLECFVVLAGDEYQKITSQQRQIASHSEFTGKFVSSQPLEEISPELVDKIFSIQILDRSDGIDAQNPVNICFQLSLIANCSNIFLAGFDGYFNNSAFNLRLHNETSYLIEEFSERKEINIKSLTKSSYNIEHDSIYFQNQK